MEEEKRFDLTMQKYIDWKIYNVTKIKNGYGYRVVLCYMDGSEISQQKSGFSTKKAASADRDKTMGELYAGTYVVYANVRVKDYLSFWLEEEMRPKITNSTYETYRHVIRKYIDAEIGHIRMIELKRSDVQKLYNETANKAVSAAKHAKTIMNTSMRYALNKKIISVNPATYVSLPKMVKKEKYHTRNIDTKKTLNVEQMLKLIEASKDSPIHIQVLFAALLGLRRSEINGVKYSDIDYINRTLTVQRQLGKKSKGEEENLQGRSSAKQEIGLKTSSSYRTVPLPDYVFEAILEERKKYERNRRRRRSVFQDFDYICCSNEELCFAQFFVVCPRSKDFHWKYFKKLLKENDLPDIRWHDLRSSFCTLLLKNDFNPKAVSKLMGHAKEIITIDVYGDKAEIIEDCLEELQPFIDEVLPGEEKVATDFSEDDYVECFGSFLA
ncbi:MAG: site-specific integrase [Lachnospiraceae bacterium]|nr:site-specific integrase [Lachnospiraceae bacterium]